VSRENLDELRALRDRMSGHWEYEDSVYRFYHGSFKVFGVQRLTLQIVAALQMFLPDRPLNDRFLRILSDGTGKDFTPAVNATWDASTRPLLEAFFHARYFLEMAVKYGAELDEPPTTLPSGWAGLLYLYNLR
jgi:hypothetical protein